MQSVVLREELELQSLRLCLNDRLCFLMAESVLLMSYVYLTSLKCLHSEADTEFTCSCSSFFIPGKPSWVRKMAQSAL